MLIIIYIKEVYKIFSAWLQNSRTLSLKDMVNAQYEQIISVWACVHRDQ